MKIMSTSTEKQKGLLTHQLKVKQRYNTNTATTNKWVSSIYCHAKIRMVMRDKLNVKTCFTHKELLDKAIKKNCHEHFGILKNIKFEQSSSKKLGFICFNESPLKMMNNAFYFILKVFLFLRDLQFCPDFFGYVGKRLDKES